MASEGAEPDGRAVRRVNGWGRPPSKRQIATIAVITVIIITSLSPLCSYHYFHCYCNCCYLPVSVVGTGVCEKRLPFGELNPWEDELSEHQIGGRI